MVNKTSFESNMRNSHTLSFASYYSRPHKDDEKPSMGFEVKVRARRSRPRPRSIQVSGGSFKSESLRASNDLDWMLQR
jgi:hypothetical protein